MNIHTESQLEEIDYMLIERGIAWLTAKDEVSNAAAFEEFVEAFLQIASLNWESARHRAHMMKRAIRYIDAILKQFNGNRSADELKELQRLSIEKFEQRITDKFIEGTLNIVIENPSAEILQRREEIRSEFKQTLAINLSTKEEVNARLSKEERLLNIEAITVIQFTSEEQALKALPKVKEFAEKIGYDAWVRISTEDPTQVRFCANMNQHSAKEIEQFSLTAADQLREKGFTKFGTSKNSKIGCMMSHWVWQKSNAGVVDDPSSPSGSAEAGKKDDK